MQIDKKIVVGIIALFLVIGITYGGNRRIKETSIARNMERLESNVSKEVVVAVIDSGLNIDETIDEDRIKWIDKDNRDVYGHGTDIVSLILHNTTENIKVMPVKVTDSSGSASMHEVCAGIRKAVENGADIINLSMNTAFYTEETELEQLIDELYKENIYVIVSAGNDRENTKYLSPANIDSAIVVSAVDDNKTPFYYTNYGDTIDFCAYGNYNGKLGTSFASAYVVCLCAEMLSNGETDIESKLIQFAEKLENTEDEKYYGYGYIGWETQNNGDSEADESTVYVGVNNKTQNNLGFDILSVDWKNIPKEKLDAILGETDYKYVGLFLSRLSDDERDELRKKSNIVNTSVTKINMKYDDKTSSYETYCAYDVGFVDYCLDEYEKNKNTMFITSEWYCGSAQGVFYISSPDRKKIYKYVLSGLYGKAWCDNNVYAPFQANDINIDIFTYKNEASASSFKMPIPSSLTRIIAQIRATRVDRYSYSNGYLDSVYTWTYIGEGVDDANSEYGISIDFYNYSNTKTGYHNDANSIVAYNAEDGIGITTNIAKSYNYHNLNYGGQYEFNEQNFIDFRKIINGYADCYYNGVFNPGYNWSNATTLEQSLSYWLEKTKDNIYFMSGESSISDNSGTFTLNITCPPLALGTSWYEQDNSLKTKSNIPEFVFNLAPNTYTVVFNGNGATGGSTASQAMTYDVGYHLNANGFTRTGYTFAGWSTSPNGPVQYNDGHYVSNMTATNGGTVTLYAQWKSSGHTLAYNANGGTGAPASQTIKVGITNKISSTKPTRTGYTFKYWTTTSYDLTNDYHYGVSQPTNGSYIKRVWMNYISSSVMEILVYADNTASVEVPTWTTLNGQDDLVWHKLNKGSWTAGGQKFNFGGWIYISEHNGEVGEYIHHAYAFNSAGGTLESKAFRNHGFIYHPNDTYAGTMSGGTQILYAQWKANAYKIAFNGNGATGGSTASINCTYNTTATLTANGFSRTGYTFTGWNTKANGTGVSYADKASVKNLTYTNGATVTLYAQWKANTYKIAFNGNGATGGSTASMNCTYNTTATLTANGFSRTGYTFTGWNTKANGTGVSYADKASVKNLTYTNGTTITLYAQWTPNKYTVHFDANGGEGVMEDVVLSYDLPENLPYNSFTRNNGYGDSLFLGWNIVPDTREVLYRDGAEVVNMTEMDGSTLTLYAVWDDCPWIIAEDLYYTLEEARSGLITYDELMNHASAEDREAGGIVQPGIDEGRGTSFVIIDYAETDFTQFEHDGSVTETYRVIDSIGNEYKKMITVYIVDTATAYINPEGTTRFINEKYYYESYENGGLEDNSIWKTDPEYVQVIEQAFENSRNNTPIMSFYFTHEEILAMKEFVRVNGIGNFKSEDALQRFYEQFMEPNIMN